MSEQLLRDIFDFLGDKRPEFGMPDLIILGGSQTLDGGKHKTQDSDYDVVVLFPNIERAESYTFTSQDGLRAYDLMLRDRTTLAHDIEQAQNIGKGTLLHITSYGQAVYDPQKIAQTFQKTLKKIYDNGPHMIDINGMQDELYTLQHNFFHIPQGDAFAASLNATCNHIARNALRFSGDWTSTGKIAGRFLKHAMPDFSTLLRTAFDKAIATHTTDPLYPFINKHLPRIYFNSNASECKQFATPPTVPHYAANPTDLGSATASARLNLNAFAEYLQSDNHVPHQAAITWAHLKLNNVIKPLTPDRFQNKPEEYFLSLGRAISAIADIEAASATPFPMNSPMVRHIETLFYHQPAFVSAYTNALQGNAGQLRSLFDSTLSNLDGHPLPNLYRPAPKDMRGDASIFDSRNLAL